MEWQGAGNEERSCSDTCILRSSTAAEGLVPDICLQRTSGELLTAVSETEGRKKRLGVGSPGHDGRLSSVAFHLLLVSLLWGGSERATQVQASAQKE